MHIHFGMPLLHELSFFVCLALRNLYLNAIRFTHIGNYNLWYLFFCSNVFKQKPNSQLYELCGPFCSLISIILYYAIHVILVCCTEVIRMSVISSSVVIIVDSVTKSVVAVSNSNNHHARFKSGQN